MNENKERYFNFPIQLLDGFLENEEKCLMNIIDYCLYKHTLNYELGDEEELIESAKRYFNISGGDNLRTYINGEHVLNSLPKSSPIVSVKKNVFRDYSQRNNSEVEKVYFLSFMALKSIIGNQGYSKVTYEYWFSRMQGEVKQLRDMKSLNSSLRKYFTLHYKRKIREELELNWGLKTTHGRGNYFSFKLSYEKLADIVEKKRVSYRKKELQKRKKTAQLLARNNHKNNV